MLYYYHYIFIYVIAEMFYILFGTIKRIYNGIVIHVSLKPK